MAETLILWGHALAALLFGAAALGMRGPRRDDVRPAAAMGIAATTTALWSLAVAGIGATAPVTELARATCSGAWLVAILIRGRRDAAEGRAVLAVAWVVGAVLLANALLVVVEAGTLPDEAQRWTGWTRTLLGALAAAGALLVLCHVMAGRAGEGAWLAVAAPGLIWAGDLILSPGVAGPAIVAVRGMVLTGAALLLTIAPVDRAGGRPAVSRALVLRLVPAAGLALYIGLVALAADGAALLFGGAARAARTVVILGATGALLASASTPWLRAWLRVKVAKHLFDHRYDYRVEWQRFTATLALPGGVAEPLGLRVVRALAELTDSPAGLLLSAEAGGLVPDSCWRWSELTAEACRDPDFATHLSTGRIMAIDTDRNAPAVPMPEWLRTAADAWTVVPLLHGDTLVGAIVLARPPVARALDWEDFDLLRVAGRQAASYLAEDRTHAALADAQRFDEFNRRFAFLLHDIKNVASQVTLVARNAERHADNPAFRADMIATLHDSATRMTMLLARLGAHDPVTAEGTRPVDLAALACRLAAARRAQHRIVVEGGGAVIALAQPQRLEQALGHLVQNAIEASAVEGAVTLAVRAEDGHALIEVRDRGCGMDAAFVRDRLFRPFASSKPAGFGIGAFEARQLVRAMDGALEVDSREGQGSLFRIILPAAPAAMLASAA